jgi:hypothetical protein
VGSERFSSRLCVPTLGAGHRVRVTPSVRSHHCTPSPSVDATTRWSICTVAFTGSNLTIDTVTSHITTPDPTRWVTFQVNQPQVQTQPLVMRCSVFGQHTVVDLHCARLAFRLPVTGFVHGGGRDGERTSRSIAGAARSSARCWPKARARLVNNQRASVWFLAGTAPLHPHGPVKPQQGPCLVGLHNTVSGQSSSRLSHTGPSLSKTWRPEFALTSNPARLPFAPGQSRLGRCVSSEGRNARRSPCGVAKRRIATSPLAHSCTITPVC